jgi:hypothetical protein
MKIAAAVVALTHATQDPDMFNCWPANGDAPMCGCQLITRDELMINKECHLQFNGVPDDYLQMLTVASSYALPNRSDLESNSYKWTGFPGLSHYQLHDIVYFVRSKHCDPGSEEFPNADYFNPADFKPTLDCVDFDMPLNETDDFPLLGNFNYDVARSHQSYNLPIYGLQADQTAIINIESHNVETDEDANFVSIRNVTAHHGHGTIGADDEDCDAEFLFTLNNHLGELEYANFYLCDDPTVSGDAAPGDYLYNVPSSWTSQIFLN